MVHNPPLYLLRKLKDEGFVSCDEIKESRRVNELVFLLSGMEERGLVRKSRNGNSYETCETGSIMEISNYLQEDFLKNNPAY